MAGEYKGIEVNKYPIQTVQIKACVLYSYRAKISAHNCFNE
jgi:hypothetical protein